MKTSPEDPATPQNGSLPAPRRTSSGFQAGRAWWYGLLAVAAWAPFAGAQTVLPADVKATCTVSQADFATWFAKGTVSANGVVKPANSVTFDDATVCAFYKWAEQMFLWMTSPDQSGYVLNSPLFYDVSMLENGKRSLIENARSWLMGAKGERTFHVRGPMGLELQEKPAAVKAAPGRPQDNGVVQAGGGALLSQAGSKGSSLVYYSIQVNDVYAYFLTMQAAKGVPPSKSTFPTTQKELDEIQAFAKTTYGKTLPDANALALELKTAWVDASSVDASQYVTIKARVPVYNTSDNTKWVPTGETKKVRLALVGIHIVGSANNHPELIWATFEHVNNTPDASYAYINTSNNAATVSSSTKGSWLFCANGSTGSFNVERVNVDSTGTIIGWPTGKTPPKTVVPSDTMRKSPWGGQAYDGGGHPDRDTAANNSQIIGLNANILSMLDPKDLRRNYLHMGSVWTRGGVIPNPGNTPEFVGSQKLANTTMETYHQSMNCFDCHTGKMTATSGLSHIYGAIQPLPPGNAKQTGTGILGGIRNLFK